MAQAHVAAGHHPRPSFHREKRGSLFLCPVVNLIGQQCGAQVKKLGRHLQKVHGEKGTKFKLSDSEIKDYVKVGRKLKIQKANKGDRCPLCRHKFQVLRKHLDKAHGLNKTQKTYVLQKEKESQEIDDDNFLEDFRTRYLSNRVCGTSTRDEKKTESARVIMDVKNMVAFAREKRGDSDVSIEKLCALASTFHMLGKADVGYVDAQLRTCHYKGCRANVVETQTCKIREEHSTYKPETIRRALLSIKKLLDHLNINCGHRNAELTKIVDKILKSLKTDLGRRQAEVEALKKAAHITADDMESFKNSDLSREGEARFERVGVDKPDPNIATEMRDHLMTTLIVENCGRNSEIRHGFILAISVEADGSIELL